MKHIFHIVKFILLPGIFFILSSCGTSGGPPEPISINLTISASKNINPDIEKRASPIVVRIYQLTQIDTFNNSDFFALYENDKNILAKDLIFREEFELKPNQSISQSFPIHYNGKHIAVLAAYRDLDKAQWKSLLEINPIKPTSLKINLEEFKVTISKN